MHIPDGFLDPAIAASTYIVSIGFLAYAFYKAKKTLTPEKMSMLAVVAAGVFAAQMLNWPIPGGTSLHFVGGALAAILMGPWLGIASIFLVLLVQCLVFHDGGITALGANVLNMAIIDVFVGYLCYKAACKWGGGDLAKALGAFLGGWLGIALAGIACGFEIGFSTQFPFGWTVTVPIMGGWHLVLGIVEGIITSSVVLYIAKRAPELIAAERG